MVTGMGFMLMQARSQQLNLLPGTVTNLAQQGAWGFGS